MDAKCLAKAVEKIARRSQGSKRDRITVSRCVRTRNRVEGQPVGQGADTMKIKKPKYVHDFTDARGKLQNVFRRAGHKTVPLPCPMFTKALWLAYEAALAGNTAGVRRGWSDEDDQGQRVRPDRALLSAGRITMISPAQRNYKSVLEPFRKEHWRRARRSYRNGPNRPILGEVAKRSASAAEDLRKRLLLVFRLATQGKRRACPPHRSAHSLREAIRVRLAEVGCDAFQIGAVIGHQDLAEVQTYVEAANKKKQAEAGMAKLSKKAG